MQILKEILKRPFVLLLLVVWYLDKNYIFNILNFFNKASRNKHIELVKLLLAKGANIEVSEYFGFTSLLLDNI
jgi:hypothetical protein